MDKKILLYVEKQNDIFFTNADTFGFTVMKKVFTKIISFNIRVPFAY